MSVVALLFAIVELLVLALVHVQPTLMPAPLGGAAAATLLTRSSVLAGRRANSGVTDAAPAIAVQIVAFIAAEEAKAKSKNFAKRKTFTDNFVQVSIIFFYRGRHARTSRHASR